MDLKFIFSNKGLGIFNKMLDPAYSEELEQLTKIISDDKNWYDAEKAKLEEEYKRRRALHVNPITFIEEHPSPEELERRAFVERLIESGDWEKMRWGHTSSMILKISRDGFPTFKLVSTKRNAKIPTINLVGFTVEINVG